jgi:adenosylcobinamide-GDP ribazoletransferase
VSGASVVAVATLAMAASVLLAAWWAVPAGPVAVLGSLGAFGLVLGLALRRIGGFTGDVLGAAGMVAESVGLLVAAARW